MPGAEHAETFDPTWPYEDTEALDPLDTEPTWECAAGTCVCHPTARPSSPKSPFTLYLCDEAAVPMPEARYRVFWNGILLDEGRKHADPRGKITFTPRHAAEQILVEWAPANTPLEPRYPFRKLVYVDLAPGDREEGIRRRLFNLGYGAWPTLEENIREFQRTYARHETGRVDDVAADVIAYHDHGGMPPRGTPALAAPIELVSDVRETSSEGGAPASQQGHAAPPVRRSSKLVVTWPNAKHELLSARLDEKTKAVRIDVYVIIAGRRSLLTPPPMKLTSEGAGVVEYSIVDGVTAVDVYAEIRVELGPKRWSASVAFERLESTVFAAAQRLVASVDEGEEGKFLPAFPLPAGGRSDGGCHPLVAVTQRVEKDRWQTTVKLHTEFVDITELAEHYTKPYWDLADDRIRQARTAGRFDGEMRSNLRVLGYTEREGPPIWVAYFNTAASMLGNPDDPSLRDAKLACIVLCRHETKSENLHITENRGRTKEGVPWRGAHVPDYWFGKFLFETIPPERVNIPGLGHDPVKDAKTRLEAQSLPLADGYTLYLEAGFGRAMVAVPAPYVFLCPVPSYVAQPTLGGDDPHLTFSQALRVLWAGNHLAHHHRQDVPVAGDYILLGYSQGGDALWPMWRKMLKREEKRGGEDGRVTGLFAIDPNGVERDGNLKRVTTWLAGDERRFFGLTTGWNTAWGEGGHASAVDLFWEDVTKQDLARRVMVAPDASQRQRYWTAPTAGAGWIEALDLAANAGSKVEDLLLPIGAKGSRLTRRDHQEARHGYSFYGTPGTSREADGGHFTAFLRGWRATARP